MKRQILISLLALLSATGFAGAASLPLFGFSDSLLDSSDVYKQDELIVRFADPDGSGQPVTGPWSTQTVRSMMSSSIVPGAEVDKVYDNVAPGLAVIRLPRGTGVLSALTQFNGSADVIYAEPNYRYKLFLVPNDPNYPEQWALDNTGQTGGTPDADIDADEAWDINTGSSDIIIAITDSGIDYEHPDLADNMWVNEAEQNGTPGVDDDGNGYVDDIYGYDFAGASSRQLGDGDSDPNDNWFHGTHVAGIAGAVTDNGVGIAGLCWDVRLMALKIIADDFAIDPGVFASDAVEAINYAVNNGAKIINASWGGSNFSQALYDAISDAGDAGVLFVAAAGNDFGNNNDINPVYPASYDLDNIVSVMSTDATDNPARFSNFGPISVDIAEPGEEILSTAPRVEQFPMLVFGVSTNYATLSGTSLSAPYASAACALIWSEFPTLPASLVKGLLLKSADSIASGTKCCVSDGRLDVHTALTLIPKGRAGKVLNAKDDPTDLTNLYDTIQDAIDDANDGDVLIAEADTLFIEAINFKGKAITLRSGDITDPNDETLSPHNTLVLGLLASGSVVTFANGEGPDTVIRGMNISWGSGDYGAGISCNGASPTIEDCIITNNFANLYGAGIDCFDAAPTIRNCTITGNQTLGASGIGGGINCEQASPVIANCLISDNLANSIGGGIACFESAPTIYNCVIANNSAVYGGGGIDLDYSSPVIANCTIIVDDPNAPKDGGISANHDSFPVVTNCILWGNGDDLCNASATYSCIEDNDKGQGNIHVEPTFTTGPLGDYYLSQTAAGQLIDSTCVDLGNVAANPELEINTYTTRTDGVPDDGALDIGAHYPALPALLVNLIIAVVDQGAAVDPNLANGTIEPESGMYRQFEVVNLTATPKDGYRVKAWTGTDDDSSTSNTNMVTLLGDAPVAAVAVEFEEVPLYMLRTEVIGGHGTVSPYHKRGEYYPDGTVVTVIAIADSTYIVGRWSGTDDDTSWASTNTITIDSDKDVTILFRQPKTLLVPGQFSSVGMAIEAAHSHGDKIIVSPGDYFGGFDFQGKALTIASERPDDPCSVASTIISTIPGFPAFVFQSGEGHESVVDGFTIVGLGDLGWFPTPDGIGTPGNPSLGGAISCINGSSPTLAHLVIRDIIARGSDGENNAEILPTPDPAPDPLDPLDPNDPLPDPEIPDPTDPNQWAPADPNRPDPPDPDDPNAAADGFDGLPGADGLPGEPGMNGLDGLAGMPGGDGGAAHGGAMYFDADSSPVILNCTFINCIAIGGDGGYGGQGQDGGDGQDGQPGMDGQEGQVGGEGLNGGEQGVGGNGGNGGDGGVGGNGGRGGDGGRGGQGGEALGGAIYFGPNCTPTIQLCKIINCNTRQGLGNRGGSAGSGGNGGVGAAPGEGADGGDGSTGGTAGAAGAESAGGNGGDGGIGGNMAPNGLRSWAGAIYFGENCQANMSETLITDNFTTIIVPFVTSSGGDGGNGGNGGDGEGAAPGGMGGIGGDGGAGGAGPSADPNDPNFSRPGIGGAEGVGGAGGDPGLPGLDGLPLISFTTNHGGANYYETGCNVEINDCVFRNNASRQYDGSGGDGGAEYYQNDCVTVLNRTHFTANKAGAGGRGGAQFFNPFCSIEINACNYSDNASGNSGGGLYLVSDCEIGVFDSRFVGNVSAVTISGATTGGAIFAGGVWDPSAFGWRNGSTIAIDNSFFAGNRAAFGGGMVWHGDDVDMSITGSVFSNNVAENGGAMYWTGGAPLIADSSFTGNQAKARWFMPNDIIFRMAFTSLGPKVPRGGGGAIFCWSSDATIENCVFSTNSSAGSAGAVFLGGEPSTPSLHNCLIRGNSAVVDGGGVTSFWLTTPTISNCTIIDNKAIDPADPKHGKGGGLSCSYESRTTLINSILWGNTGTNGSQISVGSDDEPIYIDRPAALTVSYSDVQGGRKAVYTEPGRILNWLSGNIDADPQFAVSAFLSPDSPCVNAGSDSAAALGLGDLTTSTDEASDTGTVDMGFHYSLKSPVAGRHLLTVRLIGDGGTIEVIGKGGTLTANGWLFDKFTVVKLLADVKTGHQVKWLGTDDDSSEAFSNTVTMDSDRTVTLEFKRTIGKTVTVPGDFQTLQEAINAAEEGDTIMLDPGIHYGGGFSDPTALLNASIATVVYKPITITSRNPGDPNVVSATIIDGYAAINNFAYIGVLFTGNTGPDTILDGITIQNCGGEFADGGDGDRNNGRPNGEDGTPGRGAAILIDNGASPIIRNCIIRDNTVDAGDGGNGENATDIEHAGRGGWGGWAQGGGIYCGPDSRPQFINCIIENNVALGGNGGNGGDWDGAGTGQANYGGNYSKSQAVNFDPNSLAIEFVDGDLWKALDWDFGPAFGPVYGEPNLISYFGDYRRYSAYGGGAYCDIGSNVSFVDCQIRGNQTFGGMSGIGGVGEGGRNEEPLVSFEMPTYGAGVYCAANATVTFTGCTFENNVASPVDPNFSLDPYLGYGGGVAAEESAGVVFIDCNFVDNQADSGGGIYLSDTDVTIIDCNLVSNTALRGGGLASNSSSIDIFGTEIVRNIATADPNDPNDPNSVSTEDILASGAGLYCLLGGLNVRDCNVSGNVADFSGGGAYVRDVDQASFINNLITNNVAGRDGGGLSIGWFADAVIANCTFVGNAAPGTIGETDKTGFGGGLFTSHGNNALVTDSIFWDNFGLKGNAMALGGNTPSDKRPSTLTVTHSLVKDARAGIWVESGSTLNWPAGNISANPRFATGLLDGYYLSQIKSGQGINSPALNAGSNYASAVGLVGYTTRTDDVRDEGIVDIGYHHPKEQPCRMGDLAFDGIVNFLDFARLAESWLDQSCSESNAWCRGADITTDENVDFRDVMFMADCWLAQDTLPPSPNPSEWDTEPNLVSGGTITMTAETSYDAWGWVPEYFFDCVDDKDCHDSGWQTSPTYTDGGLPAGVEFGYRVRTRDGVDNMTEWSPIRYAGLDSTPPAPAPFIETYFAASETSTTMTASTVYDDSDVEYYFENTTIDGHDSGWQDDPNYTDPNLLPDTEYSYRVKARDKSPWANETDWSEEIVIRTLATPDVDPPDPNPMDWDPTQDPNGFDGSPREISVDPNSQWGYGATMTAVVAVDAGGGPVEYFFECITNSGFNSGWIATETYTVLLGRPGQGHIFRVRARDQFGNMTAWSREDRAD